MLHSVTGPLENIVLPLLLISIPIYCTRLVLIYSRHVLVSLHSSERRTCVPCVLQAPLMPPAALTAPAASLGVQAQLRFAQAPMQQMLFHTAAAPPPGITYVFVELRKLAAQPPLLSAVTAPLVLQKGLYCTGILLHVLVHLSTQLITHFSTCCARLLSLCQLAAS